MRTRFILGWTLPVLYWTGVGGIGFLFLVFFVLESTGDNLFSNCCSWFINTVLTFFSGWLGKLRLSLFRYKTASLRIWELRNPKECAVCLSSHKWVQKLDDTGNERYRYGVGEGQIRALPYVINSLQAAYKSVFSWDRIFNARSSQADNALRGDNDLILIGGPATNPLSENILNQLRERVDIKIVPYQQVNINFPGNDGPQPDPWDIKRPDDLSNTAHLVEKDYAIVLHASMLGATKERKVVLIAGSTTFGTGAAAQFFCTRMYKEKRWLNNESSDYVAIIGCMVDSGETSMENTWLDAIYPIPERVER